MAGLFFALDTLSLNEPEPEYVKPTPSGMTTDAMFQRYIDVSDACVEAEMRMSYDAPNDEDETALVALIAKLHSVASIAFKPIPELPFFPWKAPVR